VERSDHSGAAKKCEHFDFYDEKPLNLTDWSYPLTGPGRREAQAVDFYAAVLIRRDSFTGHQIKKFIFIVCSPGFSHLSEYRSAKPLL